jgi:hypothetical protein
VFAYWLPTAGHPIDAAEHPSARRLLPAGPWQFSAHPQGGTLASWKDPAGRAPTLDEFGPGRLTADGLTYYPAKEVPAVAALMRPNLPSATVVTLSSGAAVPIVMAASSPRKLVFAVGGVEPGDYLTEYASLAEQLREKARAGEKIGYTHPMLGRVVLLALQHSLRATEEVLTDMGIVSTADFLPIVRAAWGYEPDPLPESAGDGPSPSPAQG